MPEPIVAVLLAGGRATRMGGGDKCLRPLAGRPILDHVLGRISPQVGAVALSANGGAERFAAWTLPVLADGVPGHPGPLAGILAGMRWAARVHPEAARILSVPSDTPFLPADLVARLQAAEGGSADAIVIAASAGRRHPVVALWPVALADALEAALRAGERKVGAFAVNYRCVAADFDAVSGDPFLNINRPEDLAAAEARLAARS
jgi:molybdopterin-guanine dinucleotide biosynthesis protein A